MSTAIFNRLLGRLRLERLPASAVFQRVACYPGSCFGANDSRMSEGVV